MLLQAGVTHVILAVSYHAEKLEEELNVYAKQLGIKISATYESEPLGTGKLREAVCKKTQTSNETESNLQNFLRKYLLCVLERKVSGQCAILQAFLRQYVICEFLITLANGKRYKTGIYTFFSGQQIV